MRAQYDSGKVGKGIATRLGSRVRQLRKKAKFTQEQLSFKAGLHVTYISGIESGARNPTLGVLYALAKALGVSLSELFDGIEDSK